MWRQRYKERMHALGLSQADVLRKMGLRHQSTLKRILDDSVDPSLTIASLMASAVGWDLTQMHDGDVYSPLKIKVDGFSGVGDVWTEAPASSSKSVPLDFIAGDIVAVEITNNDWHPRYTRGDIVCGPRTVGANLHNFIGRDCIVQSADGKRYIKYLHEGRKGLFHLSSPSGSGVVTDVKVSWAAPIQIVLRATAVL